MRDLYASKNDLRENCFLNFTFATTSFSYYEAEEEREKGERRRGRGGAGDDRRALRAVAFGQDFIFRKRVTSLSNAMKFNMILLLYPKLCKYGFHYR